MKDGIDNDRVDGAAKTMGGKLKEGLGNLTGDAKLKGDGRRTRPRARCRTPSAG
jgi:uncharacterized protein YjbJ (UPF0337 family)